MYSHAAVAIDKGLGFDFSKITDLVKSALPVGLDVYKQQMQLKQAKVAASVAQAPLPVAPQIIQVPNAPQPVMMPLVQEGKIGTGTLIMIGGVILGGVVLLSLLKR